MPFPCSHALIPAVAWLMPAVAWLMPAVAWLMPAVTWLFGWRRTAADGRLAAACGTHRQQQGGRASHEQQRGPDVPAAWEVVVARC